MAVVAKDLDGYVGFANLPNQVFRKAVQKGFEFTLMVVGQSGLGKSTLLNSLFLTDLYADAVYPESQPRLPSTTEIHASTVEMTEGGVRLRLTVVDTPGFGDGVDNTNCWKPIVNHIDQQFEEYLNAESQIERVIGPDTRVACCLYFIAPTGHGLKALDVEVMKKLHNKVNIVPVIAKADTLTPEECTAFKRKILEEIATANISIYSFPETGEDEEEAEANRQMKERMPFAVIGSNAVLEVNGKRLRARKYPWGITEVENGDHCDFSALRNMLIRTHMQDLKEVTDRVHYETYRFNKLSNVVGGAPQTKGSSSGRNPLAQFEEEKKEHEQKMGAMRQEMEHVFEMKVMEKKQKLKDSANDLERRHDQMRMNLEKQQRELDERRRQFEDDKSEFEAMQRKYQQEQEVLSQQRNNVGANHKAKDKAGKGKKGIFS